jgi:hypothetical protein
VQWRPYDEVSDSVVSQELLWLCDGDSSGTQEGERPPREAGTRGLEGQQTKGLNAVHYRAYKSSYFSTRFYNTKFHSVCFRKPLHDYRPSSF